MTRSGSEHDTEASPARARTPSLPEPGTKLLGRYELVSSLKSGGMGAVFVAQQGEQRLAIKFPTIDLVDRVAVDRFQREARVLARIENPHVVKIIEAGETDDGLPFIVMEYLDGRDLAAELAARGPLPVHEACALVLQACDGVGAAHASGVIHRDLKPGNLVVCERNGVTTLKVLDFGVSKLVGGDEAGRTATGDVLGTPAYMSPEQLLSSTSVDARADVWALGVVLYRLLTNALPFRGDSPVALALAITTQRPTPIARHRHGVPEALELVLRRAMAKELDERYPTITELATALRPFADRGARAPIALLPLPPPAAPRRVILPVVGALVVIATAIAGFIVVREPSAGPAPIAAGAEPRPIARVTGTVIAPQTATGVNEVAAATPPAIARPAGRPFDPSLCFARVGSWQSSGALSARDLQATDVEPTVTSCYRQALANKGTPWTGDLQIGLRFNRNGFRGVHFPLTTTFILGLGDCVRAGASGTIPIPPGFNGEAELTATITFTCP